MNNNRMMQKNKFYNRYMKSLNEELEKIGIDIERIKDDVVVIKDNTKKTEVVPDG